MNLRDEGMEVVKKALEEGAGCGDGHHVPYRALHPVLGSAMKCVEGDAYNVIDALIAAGWRPAEDEQAKHEQLAQEHRHEADVAAAKAREYWMPT